MTRQRGGSISVVWGRSLPERDVEYRVVGNYSPGDPGKLYGPPENCYPPEEAEVDFTDVFEVEGKVETRLDMGEFTDSLTQEQLSELQAQLLMEGEEHGSDLENEAAERKYDEMRDQQHEDV